MRVLGLVLVLCICLLAVGDRQRGRLRNNMLERNRTPGRDSPEDTDESIDTIRGLDICDMRGAWYNQHGSELILNQTDDGQLSGEFRSAVKLSRRTNSQDYSTVQGRVVGRVFTLSSYWADSHSMSTWSGQCHRRCDMGWLRSDGEILRATWLLTSVVSSCDDYWKATRIGEDIFTRLPIKAGPRKENVVGTV